MPCNDTPSFTVPVYVQPTTFVEVNTTDGQQLLQVTKVENIAAGKHGSNKGIVHGTSITTGKQYSVRLYSLNEFTFYATSDHQPNINYAYTAYNDQTDENEFVFDMNEDQEITIPETRLQPTQLQTLREFIAETEKGDQRSIQADFRKVGGNWYVAGNFALV